MANGTRYLMKHEYAVLLDLRSIWWHTYHIFCWREVGSIAMSVTKRKLCFFERHFCMDTAKYSCLSIFVRFYPIVYNAPKMHTVFIR